MLVLGIDTSSSGVVAVVAGADGLRSGRNSMSENGSGPQVLAHGERLAPAIDDALRSIGAGPRDLTHLVVGVGPGPFTGLRVGLVTARVMAEALGIPVVGVCSLDIVARSGAALGLAGSAYSVVTDARRREVYVRRYDAAGVALDDPFVSRAAELPADLRESPVLGEGAALYPEAFTDVRSTSGLGVDDFASLAVDLVEGRAAALVRDTTPLYLRRPDAVESVGRKRVTQP
jgi:tRNA threonylcarbamoyl adenosine modification protein YeaZ